ncbi:uncharacterized protein LOC133527370 [Cydia pomonella]|uniref:uncharacterized protein LOC133527370 n=1 Tax=Cydia pomonella TaxID=82600 RepID=UPI002ADE6DF1|nr:uncharacterized protein LOC133527370 [Cydia pomonella]
MALYKKKSIKGTKSKSIEMDGLTVNDLPALRRIRTLAFNRVKKTLEIARQAKNDVTYMDSFLVHYSEVKKHASKFEEAHADILSVIDSDLEVREDEIRSQFDECYFEILSLHRQLVVPSDEPSQPSYPSTSNVTQARLPKINLPNFSGNVKLWSEFYDMFNSLIHENKALSDTERMHYLVSCLSGDALALIRTFPVAAEYYRTAYETLIARYRGKRDLAFTCWKEMLDVTFKSNSPHEFRKTLDTFQENLTMLTRLDLPTDKWDFVLTYLLLSKLDSKTRCLFEKQPTTAELPTYDSLKTFLYSQCEALVRDTHFSSNDKTRDVEKARLAEKSRYFSYSGKPFDKRSDKFNYVKKQATTTLLSADVQNEGETTLHSTSSVQQTALPIPITKCSFCGEDHSILHCKTFSSKPPQERFDHAKQQRWCFNCLKPSHGLKDCKSIFKCQKCHKRHHTLLHLETSEPNEAENVCSVVESSNTCTQASLVTNSRTTSFVLLATAQINVRDSAGRFQPCRALIDPGSQPNFITERAAARLGFNRSSTPRTINGLSLMRAPVSGAIQLEIGVNNETVFSIEALTLDTICGPMPNAKLNRTHWTHVQNLKLADPKCDLPGDVDVLLGAEVFPLLLTPGSIDGGEFQPPALNTIFGWILMGRTKITGAAEMNSFLVTEGKQLHSQVERFWELDSVPQAIPKPTCEELQCEQQYTETLSRDPTGRYIVTLPFKENAKDLYFPGSRESALRRFHSLERKLSNNRELHAQYSEFMADYLKSGHMSLVPINELSQGRYYVPHHCILRPDSVTTKLRVVFDASAKDARGISLNEMLLIGPKLQTNILDILCRFRINPIVFTADMRQMYRQLLIDEHDRDYQRIFWRFHQSEPIQEYRLNTVTYGVSSAPFLACRTIKQLAHDEGDEFPLAKSVLQHNLYVDDIVSGSPSFEEAKETISQVITLLKRGQFELRKWASNHPELLAELPAEHCLTDFVSLDYDQSHNLKVLGLKWNPVKDVFTFEVNSLNRICTKRTILSELARIFDPMGFLCPLTLLAKCFIQRLWIACVGWDQTPPDEIVEQWKRFSDQLSSLQLVEIPRCLSIENMTNFQIHGFSDSSEAGYGAVVYLSATDVYNRVHTYLLLAKSRVCPIKRVSLARLELCAAVLLADLLKYVKEIYSSVLPNFKIFAWSDSTVALSWIKAPSHRWKTFVANRVSHIQESIPDASWNHVPSADNPADIASRGLFPVDLLHSSLWWAGPEWLRQPSETWPSLDASTCDISDRDNSDIIAEERTHAFIVQHDTHFLDDLLEKYSSIRKVQRIIAYCQRFIRNLRNKQARCQTSYLNLNEIHNALRPIVKHVQSQHFHNEIIRIQTKKPLSKSMRKLNPFIDKHGILRVGGRLSRSGLEFDHKHPALLPRKDTLTYRIIEAFHRENCHPGTNTLHYLLTQQFWILSPIRAIRHCISKCIS